MLRPLEPVGQGAQGRARHLVLRPLRRRLGVRDARRLRFEDLPRRPDHHAAGRLGAPDPLRLRLRHRHDDLARGRRLRHRRRRRRAARHPDGRLQAGRGLLRALRLVRALSAGLGLRAAADPVGRHRRDPEAPRHLHRLGVPDRAHGRGRGRPDPARPRRGRLHARRLAAGRRAPRADPGERAGDRRDPAPRARLGLDLRHRRRAHRLLVRDRPHDHRQRRRCSPPAR